MLMSGHTPGQKANYLRFMLSKKREVLTYDPVTISVVATSRCTLACDMCPTHSQIVPRDYEHAQKGERDIDLAAFKRAIDRFSNATTVQIIGSGEPLLNKDFFAMVEYAAGKRMSVKTFSNGTTIKENLDRILASKLDGITVSINGHNAQEFSRMTGMDQNIYHGVYAAVRELIKEKRRRGSAIKVKLSFIIDRCNYRSIPAMVDTALALGVDHAFFCNFLSSPFDGLRAGERALMADAAVIGELKAIFSAYDPAVRRKLTPPVLIDTLSAENRCETYFSQIRIDGDGNAASCSMMLLNMAGHGDCSDKGVWNGPFFRDMRRRFLLSDGSIPEPCKVCPDNRGVRIG